MVKPCSNIWTEHLWCKRFFFLKKKPNETYQHHCLLLSYLLMLRIPMAENRQYVTEIENGFQTEVLTVKYIPIILLHRLLVPYIIAGTTAKNFQKEVEPPFFLYAMHFDYYGCEDKTPTWFTCSLEFIMLIDFMILSALKKQNLTYSPLCINCWAIFNAADITLMSKPGIQLEGCQDKSSWRSRNCDIRGTQVDDNWPHLTFWIPSVLNKALIMNAD